MIYFKSRVYVHAENTHYTTWTTRYFKKARTYISITYRHKSRNGSPGDNPREGECLAQCGEGTDHSGGNTGHSLVAATDSSTANTHTENIKHSSSTRNLRLTQFLEKLKNFKKSF
jgi:hypothetical protein